MLFNSYVFICLFLPTVVAVFFLAGRYSAVAASLWLGAASLLFYGMWAWSNLWLLAGSILFNYFCGRLLGALAAAGSTSRARLVLWGGVAANLLCLGYFKYSNFFAATVADLLVAPIPWASVVLPLGISFFTFTQIAFLVDVAGGHARETRFDHYLLFVSYFPHLIAGPILHHAEIMPQFGRPSTYRPRAEAFAVGTTVFVIGLFKKVVLADSMGPYADALFAAALSRAPTLFEAWAGVLCYHFQIYFDFSAYMDMAIGISLLLNIKLPINFDSPYKARSIIDFWRRWHMTLSRFLREYLYIPLGGNRKGASARYVNLMVTMLLGGLWHGAGWTFVVWGGLHGLFLVVNHVWRHLSAPIRHRFSSVRNIGAFLSWTLTFVAVVIAWVFFRAPDLRIAAVILKGMAGLSGTIPPYGTHLLQDPDQKWWLLLVFVIAVFMPNVRELMRRHELTLPSERERKEGCTSAPTRIAWQPHALLACVLLGCFVVALMMMTKVSPFLYFQF
jgi:D-alanyl-lipoteichoic acid acyltransferase DltB (MBOAT superfamily)